MKLSFDMKKGLPEDSKNHSTIGGGGIAPKIKHFMFDPHLYIYLGEDYQMGSKLMPLILSGVHVLEPTIYCRVTFKIKDQEFH